MFSDFSQSKTLSNGGCPIEAEIGAEERSEWKVEACVWEGGKEATILGFRTVQMLESFSRSTTRKSTHHPRTGKDFRSACTRWHRNRRRNASSASVRYFLRERDHERPTRLSGKQTRI